MTEIDNFSLPTEAEEIKTIDIKNLSKHPDLMNLGLEAKRRTIEGVFAFSACVKALKERESTITKGGSNFGALAEEWWGLSPSESSRWLKIGENRQLLDIIQNLPESYKSISIIAGLTPKQLAKGIEEKVINPKATQASIIEYKVRVTRKKEAKRSPDKPEIHWLILNLARIKFQLPKFDPSSKVTIYINNNDLPDAVDKVLQWVWGSNGNFTDNLYIKLCSKNLLHSGELKCERKLNSPDVYSSYSGGRFSKLTDKNAIKDFKRDMDGYHPRNVEWSLKITPEARYIDYLLSDFSVYSDDKVFDYLLDQQSHFERISKKRVTNDSWKNIISLILDEQFIKKYGRGVASKFKISLDLLKLDA